MTSIDRRAMLRTLLGGAAAAAAIGLSFGGAESAPLMMDPGLNPPQENLVEKARTVVVHHHHHRRGPVVHHHRHRRHTCWWHRGHRVCGWR